jgi:hypothetical protein
MSFSNVKGRDCPRGTTASEVTECQSTNMKKSEVEMNEKVNELMSTA